MARVPLLMALTAAALTTGLGVGLGLPAAPAGASCAGDPDLARAMANHDVVFVGTVVSSTNAGRWATFAVEEVWNGDVGDAVVVKAGPAPTGDPTRFSASSVDRTYQPGSRYLVDANASPGPFPLEPGELGDNACSATAAWKDSLAAQRPDTARPVHRAKPLQIIGELADPKPTSDRSPWAVAAGIVAVVVIVAVVLWLLFRRGSIADRARTDVPDPSDTGPEPPAHERATTDEGPGASG